ncbi:Alpha/Beta hydrolase protein [Scleroderma yunnanense]
MSSVPIPPAGSIPLTFTASFKSWWHAGERQGAAAEERLLRRLPFFLSESATSDIPVSARTERVNLSTPKHFLNTLSIKSSSPSSTAPPPAVVLHGYGAGIGFFFPNYLTLASWAGHRGTDIYALDWLGMGRSARVPFHVKAKRDDIAGRVHEAESFFINSLEDWRDKMGLDKMTLIGHSLGAYFSVAYALRYPTRVHKLILLSPAGVTRDPNNLTSPSRELTDTGDTISTTSAPPAVPASANQVRRIRNEQTTAKRQASRVEKLITYMWEEGWSPFQIVRSTFFWGPMLVGRYSSRRFPGLAEDEVRDLHEYLLNITLAKGSSEYCISHIFAPFAHARMPLVDRISALKIPITFVYGEHDWMDPLGGMQSLEKLGQAGNRNGRMFVVPGAGHHGAPYTH